MKATKFKSQVPHSQRCNNPEDRRAIVRQALITGVITQASVEAFAPEYAAFYGRSRRRS